MNDLLQFETSAIRNGWRIDTVNGTKHYVSHNEKGVAMVGPRARRRKGWSWSLFKRKATEGQAAVRAWDGEAANPALVQVMKDEVKFLERVPRIVLPTLSTPPDPQEPGRVRRFKDRWLDRVYSPLWHQAVKNTATDVVMWTVALFAVVVMVRGALWVISL